MTVQPKYPKVSFNILGVPATEVGVAFAGFETLFRAGVPHEEAAVFLNEAMQAGNCDRALDVAMRWMKLVCVKRKPGPVKYIYRDPEPIEPVQSPGASAGGYAC